ncbi:hypothetical protein [Glycocaulis alkaliphilus]|uniref:hypothetical protein n=1 Tax=Glycocaulis alkaliphilus TaxID=1434191 RepID=UPI000FD9B60E|nr:hypothetical protein [Glycocaulis alkaliphilus]GGB72291.1 hypothetical protein GCM10007417_10160 [Glycocaulis alkaliphilus]
MLAYEFLFLKSVYDMRDSNGTVGEKYKNTWDFYSEQYPGLCQCLVESEFDFAQIIPGDWNGMFDAIRRGEGYFGQ